MLPPMFTGLIEEIGRVLWIRATDRGTQLQVAAPRIAEDVHKGDSIAVNGCCLTVKAQRDDQLTFDLLEETLDRTNLRTLRRDSPVNLERALSAQSPSAGISSKAISIARSASRVRSERRGLPARGRIARRISPTTSPTRARSRSTASA